MQITFDTSLMSNETREKINTLLLLTVCNEKSQFKYVPRVGDVVYLPLRKQTEKGLRSAGSCKFRVKEVEFDYCTDGVIFELNEPDVVIYLEDI